MARHEDDREDLLAEATALVERAEFFVPGRDEPVVVGFRRNGAASFYFGQDEAWHFTSSGRLRRGYREGLLYKADRGRLARLERRRTEQSVDLVRRDLVDPEAINFLESIGQSLIALQRALGDGTARLTRQFPPQADVRARALAWLQQLRHPVSLARSPRAR